MTADADDARVRMDEYGYIYDDTDSDHTENSEECSDGEEPGSIGDTSTPDVDNASRRRGVQNVTGRETQILSDAFATQPINLESTNCEVDSSLRPRRNLRRPARYDGFNTQFANSQYIRRIRMDFSRENGRTSESLSTKSRDATLQKRRPLIGPDSYLGQPPIADQYINESFVDVGQLSHFSNGDNSTKSGKLRFFAINASQGDKLYDSGIWPIDRHVFSADHFLPSSVTDRPDPVINTPTTSAPVVVEPETFVSPQQFRGYPKVEFYVIWHTVLTVKADCIL